MRELSIKQTSLLAKCDKQKAVMLRTSTMLTLPCSPRTLYTAIISRENNVPAQGNHSAQNKIYIMTFLGEYTLETFKHIELTPATYIFLIKET